MAVAVVAAEFSELAFHLRGVREGQRRAVLGTEVKAVDLVLNNHVCCHGLQGLDKVAHRLGAVARSVVDRLHQSHLSSTSARTEHTSRSPGRDRPCPGGRSA